MTEDNIHRALSLMGIYKARTVNGNVMCQCALPMRHSNGDRKASLSIKVNDSGVSLVYCFGCQLKSTVVGLAYEVEKSGFGANLVRDIKALEFGGAYRPPFKEYDSVKYLRFRNDMSDWNLAKKEKAVEVDEKEYAECFTSVPKYLIEKRKIDIDTARAWKVGHWHKGRKGVFFPVYDCEKRFVGYTIRWIFPKEDEASYFHMPGMHRRKILYGENMLDPKRSNKYVIVEGPIDSLWIYMAGYNALGTLGGGFSDIQMSKVLNLCKDMQGFVMGDGDKGGKTLNDEVIGKMKEKAVKITRIDLRDGADPDDLPIEEVKCLIEGSKKG